jgi:hypothetical protein
MIWGRLLEGFLICLPVVILLVVGAAIALHSGVDEVETSRDYRQIARNLSQMVLRVAGYVAILLAVQYMVGLRPSWAGRDAAVIPVPAHSGRGIANPR